MSTAIPEAHAFLVWCGREGWMSINDMVEKTDAGIKAYAKMQPLRYRTAMTPRDSRGARIWTRRKVRVVEAQPEKPKEPNDKTQ